MRDAYHWTTCTRGRRKGSRWSKKNNNVKRIRERTTKSIRREKRSPHSQEEPKKSETIFYVCLPIGSGTRKHFVLTKNHERVDTDAKVESFLTGLVDHVPVDSNTSGFKGFRTKLLLLHTDQVDA